MKSSGKTFGLLAVTTIALLALGVGVASAHATRYGSHVSMVLGVNPVESTYDFHGEVTSRRAECVGGRRVTVYRKRGGADQAIGSDRSADSGAWSVSKSTSIPGGNYRAKVERREVGTAGHSHVCRGAKSETVFIP